MLPAFRAFRKEKPFDCIRSFESPEFTKMKINLILAAAIFAATFGAAVCPAQVVGNYREASKTDKAVVRAANFAVGARGKAQQNRLLELIAVERAEKQVVAGANYRLCLTVKANAGSEQATAIVYQNPQNQYELIDWTKGNCTGGETNSKSNAANTPDAVVRNLYAAKDEKSPFFQRKSRALVDKYFARELADLIWKDAIESNGEVGALGFDPLYNAQDTQITLFKVGKPMYGEGNIDVADVPVTFKNMGKSETILFRLERDARKVWKISDIYYPNSESEENDSLRKIYKIAAELPAGEAISGELQTGGSESLILYVGAESGDYAAYCFPNDSEAGRAILAACKKGEQCEVVGEIDVAIACKVPGLEADLSASGKITKVVSVKSLGRKKR